MVGVHVTVDVLGEADVDAADELTRRFCEAIDRAASGAVVAADMSRVSFIDSSGLRALLSAHRHALDSGRVFVVVNPSDMVDRVLEVAGVRPLFRPH